MNGFKTASTAASDFGNRLSDGISKNEQHINTLSNTLGGIGLAATAGAGLAVKTFMDFDAAMSNVAATGDDARGSIQQLREAAIQAGADTSFSATEAAGAIEELAKAGLSAADILGGGLDGALDLAAAGGLSVADAAQYASTAMAQFGLSGRDVTHIADLLAAGAGKANGEVSDMGAALNQAGLVASQTGLSIEETTGSLAAFAQAGLLGSDAGTSLKTMLQRLSAPSGEAAGLMAELGISAYDASGNFVGMAEFAGQLTTALGAMTPAQRNATMATIFGADAVRAAGVIYQNGEAGIRDWITAVDDQGYAAETARVKLDNLKGDLEGLGGSLETAFINGGSAANDMLRGIVQGADAAVDAIGGLPAPILNATTMLVGGGGLVALGVAGVGKLTIGLNNARIAANALGVSTKAAALSAGAIGGAIAIAAVGLTAWASKAAEARARTDEYKDTLDELGNTTDETVKKFNTDLVEASSSWMSGSRDLMGVADELGLSFQDLQGYVQGNADAIERVKQATSDYVSEGNLFEKAVGTRGQLMNDFSGFLDDNARAIANGKTETELAAAANEAAGVATGVASEATAAFTKELEASAAASQEWIDATSEIYSSFVNLGEAYQGAIDKNIELATSTADATSSSEDSWEDFYDGVSVSAADYIGSLSAQVAAQEAWAANMTNLSSRVNTTMTGDMRTAANNMIDELMQLGPEGAAQVQLLHDMSDGELQQVVELYQRKGRASGDEFAGQINKTRPNDIIVDADTSPAMAAARALWQSLENRRFTAYIDVVTRGGNPGGGTPMEARAMGGPVVAGRPYLVGEEGMEIFVPARSGTILNASDTARAMQAQPPAYVAPPAWSYAIGPAATGGGPTINNTISADGLVARGYAEQIASRVVTKQRDTMALYGIGGAP
ncbi:phage tail tape measure protein [Oerskovia sp. USHLN155]|uniref:phage tail tape measure protein n=1 Tax=Oerskovia sp. USHLN155 TaxID=3081288 RepID=UPI003018EF67